MGRRPYYAEQRTSGEWPQTLLAFSCWRWKRTKWQAIDARHLQTDTVVKLDLFALALGAVALLAKLP